VGGERSLVADEARGVRGLVVLALVEALYMALPDTLRSPGVQYMGESGRIYAHRRVLKEWDTNETSNKSVSWTHDSKGDGMY
jgi:hypothetical protein